MTNDSISLYDLVIADPRYPIESYIFVREALSFAADSLELGSLTAADGSVSAEQLSQALDRTGTLRSDSAIRTEPVRIHGPSRA